MFRFLFVGLGDRKCEKKLREEYTSNITLNVDNRRTKESGPTFTFFEYYVTLSQYTAGAENTAMEQEMPPGWIRLRSLNCSTRSFPFNLMTVI